MAEVPDLLDAQMRSPTPAQRHQAIKKPPAKQRSEPIPKLQGNFDGRKPEKRHASLSASKDHPFPLPTKSQKRPREAEDPTSYVPIERPPKALRRSPFGLCDNQTFELETVNGLTASQQSHISHWTEQKTWPKEYFREPSMHHLLARQKSSASLRRKRSEPSVTTSATSSDQRPREEKSVPYRHSGYKTLLETLGNSYMKEYHLGITEASKALLEDLLTRECPLPKESLFGDDVFHTACQNVQDKNEHRIILDFGRLLAPSPECLAAFGATNLDILVESVNEGWDNSVPITSTRPQPDFAVGFSRFMFSDVQLSKIQLLLGDLLSLSYFRATYYMYFPFLTCEVKCGTAGLEIADRQNAHSMTLAVRGIVELFRLGKKEKELHREVLTFSISHDHESVRLYGYYPVFDGPKTKIHRHKIHSFDFTALNGKEKWTTYKFTVAVYHHSLTLLKKIRSIVDDLPPDFALRISQQAEAELQSTERSGLSQPFEESMSAEVPNSQRRQSDTQQVTPDTSTQEISASNTKQQQRKR